jgi:LacI family transcriptional regulator
VPVTIRDVARMAKVDPSTVSRALNNPDGRRTAARERVLAAAEALGYQPNVLARSLTTASAPIIPLLIPDVTNWFFAEVARGAEEAARKAGFSLVLCNTEHLEERERLYMDSLVPLQVPVAIIAPNSEASAPIIEKHSEALRIVIIDRLIGESTLPSATVDNYRGGRLATEHLVSLGHAYIVCVSGPADASTSQERIRGYRSVMEEHGLEPVILPGGFTIHDGRRAAKRFLKLDRRFTAVTCANDLCAIALIGELRHAGLRIPEDVSVVGYDDLEFVQCISPALTSIHQPARRLGAKAVELALSQSPRPAAVRLSPRLVVRQSTRSPE